MKKKGASTNGDQEILFADEIAERLRMSQRQIMEAFRRGILRPYVVDVRGTPRFLLADVLEDLRNHNKAAK